MRNFGCSVLLSRLNICSLIFFRLKFFSSPVVIFLTCFYYSKKKKLKTLSLDFSLSWGYLLQRSVPLNIFCRTIETIFPVLDHLWAHIEAL